MLTQPWLRYEILATLGRLADPNLKDHSLRCSFAAGDLRAHGQLLLEELPADLSRAIDAFLYDEFEVATLRIAIETINDFFDGGYWVGCPFPRPEDPAWGKLRKTCENARQALMANGMPAWNEDLEYRG